MPLAYHILAHKNATLVGRLLRALYHPEDTFVLHCDRRAPKDLHALAKNFTGQYANVLVQKSRTVLWGGPQIPELQVEAMRLALKHSGNWSHFINLSGQDFPLQRRSTILEQLAKNPAQSFVTFCDPFAVRIWGNVENRVERWHLHSAFLNRVLSLPGLGRRLRRILGWENQLPYLPGFRRRRPDFFRYYGGSNHVVLAREACRHLVEDHQAIRIRTWLGHSAIPDETVFQSVLLNSPLASTVVSRAYRFIEFEPGTAHPKICRHEDFPRLIASGEWFARKFDDTVDSAVLDQLEAHLGVASA